MFQKNGSLLNCEFCLDGDKYFKLLQVYNGLLNSIDFLEESKSLGSFFSFLTQREKKN